MLTRSSAIGPARPIEGGTMIVRTWRGRAAPAQPDAYPEHFRFTVLPALKAIKGFRGAAAPAPRPAGRDRVPGADPLDLPGRRSAPSPGNIWTRPWSSPRPRRPWSASTRTVRHYEVIEEAVVRESKVKGHPPRPAERRSTHSSEFLLLCVIPAKAGIQGPPGGCLPLAPGPRLSPG